METKRIHEAERTTKQYIYTAIARRHSRGPSTQKVGGPNTRCERQPEAVFYISARLGRPTTGGIGRFLSGAFISVALGAQLLRFSRLRRRFQSNLWRNKGSADTQSPNDKQDHFPLRELTVVDVDIDNSATRSRDVLRSDILPGPFQTYIGDVILFRLFQRMWVCLAIRWSAAMHKSPGFDPSPPGMILPKAKCTHTQKKPAWSRLRRTLTQLKLSKLIRNRARVVEKTFRSLMPRLELFVFFFVFF